MERRHEKRLVLRREDARAVRTLGIATFAAFQDALSSLLEAYAAVRAVGLCRWHLDRLARLDRDSTRG